MQPGVRSLNAAGKALSAVLIDKSILKHKSEEIRAVAACCIADLFKQFAPTPPYTEPAQVKLVFGSFIDQLAHLAQPSHPEASHHFFLLETLDSNRIPDLLCNAEGGEAILLQMFEIFFAVAKVHRHNRGDACRCE
jgi:sister-chromatid-cohesion protein PDS5